MKHQILQMLGPEAIRQVYDAFNLTGADRHSSRAMAVAVETSPQVSAEGLLGHLGEVDLKRVCAVVGVPSRGRRQQLVRRLIEGLRFRADTFVAIDFETADRGADSACAVALVRVENGRIVDRATRLIRPPRRWFEFTYIHGITWQHVQRQGTFSEVWPSLRSMLVGAQFLAAHNAAFDRRVLEACCMAARLEPPQLPFLCTVQLARRTWGIRPTRLPDVCVRLGIPLRHHDAASDAEACAHIVIQTRNAEVHEVA